MRTSNDMRRGGYSPEPPKGRPNVPPPVPIGGSGQSAGKGAGKRKIVQVTTGVHWADEHVLYALCDDGTLWYLSSEKGKTMWVREIPIPQ